MNGSVDWEYHDGSGETFLFVHTFASLAAYNEARNTAIRNNAEPMQHVGIEAFRYTGMESFCAKSDTKAVCITLDTPFWVNRTKPSEDQIKQLLRAAI